MAAVIAAGASVAMPAAAQSLGDRVTCTASAFTCSPSATTVGSGVEFLYGPTATPFLNLDFGNNLLTVTGRFASIQLGSGQSISFRDTTNAFTSASLLTNTNSNLTASDLVFNNGLVTLNVGGRTFSNTGALTIGLTTAAAAVPEPACWAMMIVGLGGVGFALRRQTRDRRTASAA